MESLKSKYRGRPGFRAAYHRRRESACLNTSCENFLSLNDTVEQSHWRATEGTWICPRIPRMVYAHRQRIELQCGWDPRRYEHFLRGRWTVEVMGVEEIERRRLRPRLHSSFRSDTYDCNDSFEYAVCDVQLLIKWQTVSYLRCQPPSHSMARFGGRSTRCGGCSCSPVPAVDTMSLITTLFLLTCYSVIDRHTASIPRFAIKIGAGILKSDNNTHTEHNERSRNDDALTSELRQSQHVCSHASIDVCSAE